MHLAETLRPPGDSWETEPHLPWADHRRPGGVVAAPLAAGLVVGDEVKRALATERLPLCRMIVPLR